MGTAEFSDTPMIRPPEEDTYYDFFKAKHTTQYLEDYVDRHIFAGQTLRDRIQFGVGVDKITKVDGKWVSRSQETHSIPPS